MSKAVLTKDNAQCRTHHKKMLITHNSVDNIVRFFLSQGLEGPPGVPQQEKGEAKGEKLLGFLENEYKSSILETNKDLKTEIVLINMPEERENEKDSFF